MEKETGIIAFIKAIDKQFFDRFINNGQICMNTAKWFRDYEEKDENIGDSGEGAVLSCGNGFTISISDPIENYTSKEERKEKPQWSKPFSGEKLRMFDEQNANILSLYAITLSESNDNEYQHLIIPKKFIDEFSNHRFVLIIEPKIFFTRIIKALINVGKSMKSCMVTYYPLDSVMRNNLTFFDKQDRYSYQNEYRLVLYDESPKQRIINIGSLNDICLEIDLNKHYYSGKHGNANFIIIRENGSIIEEKSAADNREPASPVII